MYIEKIRKLINAIVESSDDIDEKNDSLDFIEGLLTTFPDYANIVIREQIYIPLWHARCEPDEFRIRYQELDTHRKHCHDACISSVSALNRQFALFGLETFSDVNIDDRHAVANMVGDFVIELYHVGIGDKSGMDGATYEVRTKYDRCVPGELIRQFSEGRCDM